MMWSFGVMPSDVYGCERNERPPAWIQCTYHRYYYTNALELSLLAIERYLHTLDLARDTAVLPPCPLPPAPFLTLLHVAEAV